MSSFFLLLSFLISAWCADVPAWALDPTKSPGQNFNLSIYKLATPLSDGSGGALQIFQPQLATYSSYVFYTAADGAMVFWYPTNGVPDTPGGYPRSELRQLAPGGDWVLTDNAVHILTATCKVLVQPPRGKTSIGQIHGTSNPGIEDVPLKLQWVNGTVRAAFKDNLNGNQIYSTIGTWNLGDTLSYTIQESNHLISVTVNGVNVTNLLNSTWDVNTYYFKAGNYCSDNSPTTDTVCVVAFYALNGPPGAVGAPTFSPSAGTYSSNQAVTISTPTMGTSIRYTTDSSMPTSTYGTIYTSPVNISGTTTLKAIAYDTILPASAITTGAYTITGPLPILSITASGTNVILSRPSSTDPGWVLQSTSDLTSPIWTSVGTPTIVGGQFVVTDAVSGNKRFYCLKK